MTDIPMLNSRYEYKGIAILKLNELQMVIKKDIEKKISEEIYKFEKVDCACCQSPNFESVSNTDRYGLYMPVVICKDCGLIQTSPRMTQDSYNEFYDREYRKLYVGVESPNEKFFSKQYRRGEKIFSFIKKHGGIKTPVEDWFVLEVGCGAGGVLKYFRDQGCKIKGIDLGVEYLAYGKGQHKLDLSQAQLSDLSLREQSTIIIYSHVFEHILDLNAELEQIYKNLHEGGVLYIEVPGVKNLLKSYDVDFLKYLQNAHTFHFTLTSLTNILSLKGFNLLHGNEKIRSVFSKGEISPGVDPKNDYEKAKAFLLGAERLREKSPIPIYKIKFFPRTTLFFLRILRNFGAQFPKK